MRQQAITFHLSKSKNSTLQATAQIIFLVHKWRLYISDFNIYSHEQIPPSLIKDISIWRVFLSNQSVYQLSNFDNKPNTTPFFEKWPNTCPPPPPKKPSIHEID